LGHNPVVHIFRLLNVWLLAEAHSNNNNPDVAISTQCMATTMATSMQEHDQQWFHIVMRQLDVSEDILHAYLTHGDSVLLTNLIHIIKHLAPPHNDVDQTYMIVNLDGLT